MSDVDGGMQGRYKRDETREEGDARLLRSWHGTAFFTFGAHGVGKPNQQGGDAERRRCHYWPVDRRAGGTSDEGGLMGRSANGGALQIRTDEIEPVGSNLMRPILLNEGAEERRTVSPTEKETTLIVARPKMGKFARLSPTVNLAQPARHTMGRVYRSQEQLTSSTRRCTLMGSAHGHYSSPGRGVSAGDERRGTGRHGAVQRDQAQWHDERGDAGWEGRARARMARR